MTATKTASIGNRGSRDRTASPTVQAAILELMHARSVTSRAEIREDLGANGPSESLVNKALKNLVDSGQISRVRRGLYRINSVPQQLVPSPRATQESETVAIEAAHRLALPRGRAALAIEAPTPGSVPSPGVSSGSFGFLSGLMADRASIEKVDPDSALRDDQAIMFAPAEMPLPLTVASDAAELESPDSYELQDSTSADPESAAVASARTDLAGAAAEVEAEQPAPIESDSLDISLLHDELAPAPEPAPNAANQTGEDANPGALGDLEAVELIEDPEPVNPETKRRPEVRLGRSLYARNVPANRHTSGKGGRWSRHTRFGVGAALPLAWLVISGLLLIVLPVPASIVAAILVAIALGVGYRLQVSPRMRASSLQPVAEPNDEIPDQRVDESRNDDLVKTG